MKHLTIGLMVFLLVALVEAGTLTDNFEDGNFDEWKLMKIGDQAAKWSVEDGELVCVSKNACGIASTLMLGDNTWEDYEVECQFKLEQNFPAACRSSAIGVGLHAGDVDKVGIVSLGVEISPNSGAVWCQAGVQGNIKRFPQKENLKIKEGEWYTMRVVANGNGYQMFIDDKLICDFKNDLPNKGNAMVWGRNCEAHFDNVVITGDDIPDKDLGLPVEPLAKLATMWAFLKQGR